MKYSKTIGRLGKMNRHLLYLAMLYPKTMKIAMEAVRSNIRIMQYLVKK